MYAPRHIDESSEKIRFFDCTVVGLPPFFFFFSSGGWLKIKLKLPHFHVSVTCRAPIYPNAPVATAPRAAAPGRVSMSILVSLSTISGRKYP